MEKRALILQGGWDGHEPQLTSKRFAGLLREAGFQVEISDTLESLANLEELMELDLLVACWTMGEIPGEYTKNVAKAVGAGVGKAGCHGGMCDAFRQDTEWQLSPADSG
ncbi:MAG: ThuA domain-containing protein [Oscillospiraceae bacterium]